MKKFVLFLLVSIIVVSCSGRMVKKVSYPEKFEGLTQLVLASQTKNITFVEDVSKSILAIFKSEAKVQVTSNVTYDFYIDFEKDGYTMNFSENGEELNFSAPQIRVKKPVINNSSVSYPATGLLVNEDREAVMILESLTERFIQEGEEMLNEPKVMNMCEEKLKTYLMGVCNKFGYAKVKTVNITFKNVTT